MVEFLGASFRDSRTGLRENPEGLQWHRSFPGGRDRSRIQDMRVGGPHACFHGLHYAAHEGGGRDTDLGIPKLSTSGISKAQALQLGSD